MRDGTTLTIEATPENGWKLSALIANDEDIIASKSFVVKSAASVMATFVEDEGNNNTEPTAVEDVSLASIEVVPNPFDGELYIANPTGVVLRYELVTLSFRV